MTAERRRSVERVMLPPSSGWLAVVAAERGRERVLGRIPDTLGDLSQRKPIGQEKVARKRHPPVREVLHRRLSEGLLEVSCKRRPRHQSDPCQLFDGPRLLGVLVDRLQRP
jgi:hypothetical protein